MSKSIKLKDNTYWDTEGITHNKTPLNTLLGDIDTNITNINNNITNINNDINYILSETNYKNNITSLISGLSFNANSQQIIKNKNLITINLTFLASKTINLNGNTTIFVLPNDVLPSSNVILYVRSNLKQGFGYIRAWSGEVLVNFNGSLATNEELNIMGTYYIGK